MAPITSPAQHTTTTLADVRALAAALHREHPQAGNRVDHAAFLACFREVERGTSPVLWWVPSETDPAQQYMVLAGQHCTCQDCARRGALTPCKHLLAVAITQRLERLEAERLDPAFAPIAWELTGDALAALDALDDRAALDDQRQRDAARCPDCNDYKQHGSLHCNGDTCGRLVASSRRGA